MLPVMWSYGRALTGPGSDSLQARTVEWARDNHLGWAVDRAEKWWFENHQAKVGGTPDLSAGPEVISIPSGPVAAPAATPATPVVLSSAPPVAPLGLGVDVATTLGTDLASVPTTLADLRSGHLHLPAALVTPAAEPVAGEGQWAPLGPNVGGIPGAFVTSIRPDAEHTSVLDAVVWIDPTVFSLRQYPGTKIPGAPWDRPDHVEAGRQAGLVAAFAGGFRLRDSNGGIIIGHRTLQQMRDGGATLAIDDNGMPSVGAWGVDITNSANIDSARQSLDLIVIDGTPVPDLSTDANRKWGFTGPANKTAVWRSGVGVRADGALVWVGGNGFTIETLAETLVRAGAIRGMQLEINQEWVQFNTYATGADGQVHGQRLMKGMQHTGDRWLTEDTRDFIAVFTR